VRAVDFCGVGLREGKGGGNSGIGKTPEKEEEQEWTSRTGWLKWVMAWDTVDLATRG